MIRRIGLAAVLTLLLAALAAAGCGGDDGGLEGSNESGAGQVVPEGEPGDQLTISNWPLYIDPGKEGTIADFERDTGIEVDYIEDINDNVQFFGKLRPQLARGESGGRSLITVSDWLAARMYDLGYLYELD